MLQNLFRALTGLCVLSLIVACGDRQPTDPSEGRTGDQDRPRVALIMKAISNPFFGTMAEGAKAEAAQRNTDLTVLSVPRETDFEKQAAHVEDMTAQGVAAIIIAPADSKAIVSPLLEAQKRGIHIINIDNRIDPKTAESAGLKVLTFIGPDNAAGAEKSTNYLVEQIGGKGKVAMLEGIRGVDNAEQRKRGFQRAVDATNGAVEVVAMETAEWAQDLAQQKMAGILTRHPDLDGVFCANDNMALGAIAAIESAGLSEQVHVTGYDNLEAAQDAVLDGAMDATIEQHPDRMGAMGVEYALKAINGESFPEEIEVPTDLITAETLKDNAE